MTVVKHFLLLSALTTLLSACANILPTVTTPPTTVPTAAATLSPTAPPTASATEAEREQTLTIQAVVYIRAEADANSQDIGALETGRTVVLVACDEQWCNVIADIDGKQVNGWVYRGCTSDNPDKLLCEAR